MKKNHSFKKILVGLDGSKNSIRALNYAIVLAEKTNASITGLFVIQMVQTEIGLVKTSRGKALSKHYKHFTNKANAIYTKKSIKFLDVVEYGGEGKIIVYFSQKNNYDLIVIGSRGRGKIKEVFFGSTSNYVVHSSKIPVLIIK